MNSEAVVVIEVAECIRTRVLSERADSFACLQKSLAGVGHLLEGRETYTRVTKIIQ